MQDRQRKTRSKRLSSQTGSLWIRLSQVRAQANLYHALGAALIARLNQSIVRRPLVRDSPIMQVIGKERQYIHVPPSDVRTIVCPLP